MKGKLINLLLGLIFIAGVCLLAYPFVSDSLNVFRQKKEIQAYEANLGELVDDETILAKAEAVKYNEALLADSDRWGFTDEEFEWYQSLLNLSGNGTMGYVEIPKINCLLSIGHGTSEDVLETAIGHIEGTSLPVGGIGTHCALSGHRGLPSAKLFTDLDKLAEGDEFLLHVLDDTLLYVVDQIVVVDPDDMAELAIDPEKDYCTLVTCTPYGVNSHRLLVRGERKSEE